MMPGSALLFLADACRRAGGQVVVHLVEGDFRLPRKPDLLRDRDLAATLKEAEAKGAKTLMEPEDIPGGPTIAMFADPEGNVIGLTKGM
jgi:uncharacterized glyoxalase superfamily protein PhnB